MYLNVEFSALSIADVKKGVSILKNKIDLEKAMKVNFKVKMKVTIEFFVEIYFRNDLHVYWSLVLDHVLPNRLLFSIYYTTTIQRNL